MLGWLLAALGVGYVLMQPKPPRRLVLLGDSLAVGITPAVQAWAVAHGVPLRIDAKVGRPSTAQEVGDVEGAVVIVSQGTNDAVSAKADVRPFWSRLENAGPVARIVWLVPPGGDRLPGIGAVRAQVKALPSVTAVSLVTPISADGLHPKSYAPVAAKVLATLSRWPA